MTQLCRNDLRALLNKPHEPHPGLLLARGMTDWPADGEAGGKAKAAHIAIITQLKASDLYLAALERWQKATAETGRFVSLQTNLIGRLYIGVTRENALETGVTTAHAYGMPMIPGSAVKGLCRAAAKRLKLGDSARLYMFGNETDSAEAEAGGLVFHDAWWVGKSTDKPFVREIVTPHHQDYYGSEGKTPATDFDSPIPANQIAVTGAFYFAIEGDVAWTGVAKRLLQMALADTGIGGKRSSGYGFFVNAE
jgi:CRISPR-associated protein Cmr6